MIMEINVACKWGLQVDLISFDNSKLMVRHNTKWMPPQLGWSKLNFDVVAKGNLGLLEWGYIIRYFEATFIVGYAMDIGEQYSMTTKAMAMFGGIKIALSLGIKRLPVEGDTKNIIDVFKGKRLYWFVL